MRSIVVGSVLAVLLLAPPLSAHERQPVLKRPNAVSVTAGGAAAVVDAFHAALHRGDTKAAAALMAEEAVIFESGGVERTKAEYAAHHLTADAQFSRSVSSVTTQRAGHSSGSLAWVASEGRTTGTYKGKALDLLTTETMILRRTDGGWKIVHVHWSSAAEPKA